MKYVAIDGDVSDFLDAMIELTEQFQMKELLSYLRNAGHAEHDAAAAVLRWQAEGLFEPIRGREDFGLSAEGVAAVKRLRDRRVL